MSDQMELSVVGIVGSGFCVASEDGEKVHAAIASALRERKKVVLSFNGVTDLTSAFLNSAIGQLYSEFGEDEIKANLSVTDTTADDRHVLKRVVDRAKQFFRNAGPFHQAAAQVMGEDHE
jgi:hypothetical protein